MSRYSSDSDSSSAPRRNRSSRRSSSSSSSSSSHRHKSKKSSKSLSSRYKSSSKSSRTRRRSRSQSKSSSRHSRSQSKDRRKRRSYSRDRDRYKNKHHHKSRSHSKGHGSRYYSRSSSNDTHSRHSRSKSKSPVHSPKHSLLSVTSSNNSEDQLREKLLKAIKAAESADHQLKQQGVLPKGVKSRNDIISLTSKPQSDLIKDIEADEFVQQSFSSSKNKRNDIGPGNTAIESVEGADANSIFHVSFFVDPKVRIERWAKKLYQIRQRAISGEPLA